jgi:hypothetical protein
MALSLIYPLHKSLGLDWLHSRSHSTTHFWVESSLMLRTKVSQPVSLGIKHPSGAYDQIFITARPLQVCWCRALSLTRGGVCRLQLLLALASAVIFGTESRETSDHITYIVSDLRLPFLSPPTRRATVEVFGPASARDTDYWFTTGLFIYPRGGPTENITSSIVVSTSRWRATEVFVFAGMCLATRFLAMGTARTTWKTLLAIPFLLLRARISNVA